MVEYRKLKPLKIWSQHGPPSKHKQTALILLLFCTIIFIFIYFFNCAQIFNFQHSRQHPNSSKWNSSNSANLNYLIDTSTCRLRDYPLFDKEIIPLYTNLAGKEFQCDSNLPPFKVFRVNYTWIQIEYPAKHNLTGPSWVCFGSEIYRQGVDSWNTGPEVGPLGRLNNFANNVTGVTEELSNTGRWDSVKIICKEHKKDVKYTRIVPLVQHYEPKERPKPQPQPRTNILLIGLDSVSRLNFLRHMNLTRAFLDSHGFIPMYGYHKVGENSYPNIMPMLTGRPGSDFYNSSVPKGYTFDNVPLIFNHFKKEGYLTTFLEDMPAYGFFYWRGGFKKQPTDYYLTPTNLAIWDELYYTTTCYQEMVENEIYFKYLVDAFAAFKSRGSQPHFTLGHVSTLTHNYFNHPGYADKPYHRFISSIFEQNLHQNSLILLYSDHALRFGAVLNTTASIYENRLPFFYIYVPDSLTLNGHNAAQIRAILKINQNRLTSHFDLHPTMLHVLYGKEPQDEPFGKSLLAEIPENRTCDSAGISEQYCLCNAISPVPVTPQIHNLSAYVVTHMNNLMASKGNFCVPLVLRYTYRAFESYNLQNQKSYRLVHFETAPNSGTFEAMLEVEGGSTGSGDLKVKNLKEVTRTNSYGKQSSCVEGKLDIVQFCYCWAKVKKTRKRARG